MAARQRMNRDHRDRVPQSNAAYVYGNTVRQAQVAPERRRIYEDEPKREHKVSPQVRKNRKRALKMNPAYLVFLTLATTIALVACVWYLQLRAEVSARAENIATMQQELVELKEENTTRYNSVIDSVNLEEVRERAIEDLEMVYADSEQIVTYQNPENDYVKQYEEIPEEGVLGDTK